MHISIGCKQYILICTQRWTEIDTHGCSSRYGVTCTCRCTDIPSIVFINMQIHREIEREGGRGRERERERQRDRERERQRKRERYSERDTEREILRERETCTHIHICM